MKFDNPFLKYLAKKYDFNTLGEWAVYIQDAKDKDNLNEIELLIYELCSISGYSFSDIVGKCRKRDLTEVKHIGRYIAYMNQSGSLKEIGFVFGKKDHSTVIHSRDYVQGQLDIQNKYFMKIFNQYKHLIK